MECRKCGAVRRFPVGLDGGKDGRKNRGRETQMSGNVANSHGGGGGGGEKIDDDIKMEMAIDMEVCKDDKTKETPTHTSKKSNKEKKRKKEERKKWRMTRKGMV